MVVARKMPIEKVDQERSSAILFAIRKRQLKAA